MDNHALLKAVEDWIVASYEFWKGPEAYAPGKHAEVERTAVLVRRIATGKGQLDSAYNVLKNRKS